MNPEWTGRRLVRLGTLDQLKRPWLGVEEALGNRVKQTRVRQVEVDRRGRDREAGRQAGAPPSQKRDGQDQSGDDSPLPQSAQSVAHCASRVEGPEDRGFEFWM